MRVLSTLLLAGHLLLPAASAVHTGFAIGAFWGPAQTPKVKADFLRQFNLAKNLPDVPVSFNSARLFQTAQFNGGTKPSEAFEAAIETNTTLLLGVWLGALDNELPALDAAFENHGQRLADLVVGISVGNEDIYRASNSCTTNEGVSGCQDSAFTKEQVVDNIQNLTEQWQKKSWWSLFKTPPPIGHTDIAAEAGLGGLGFAGATVYPFWDGQSIDMAKYQLDIVVQGVQNRSGLETPVWITETGWPSSGPEQGAASPTVENMQKYWTDIGCLIFGKFNVWYFQLERDTIGLSDQYDWGIIDKDTQKPKINLACPKAPSPDPSNSTAPAPAPAPAPSNSTAPAAARFTPSPGPPSQIQPPPPAATSSQAPDSAPPAPSPEPSSQTSSALPTVPTNTAPPAPLAPTAESSPLPSSPAAQQTEVVFVTTTIVVTVPGPAPTEPPAEAPDVHTRTRRDARCVTRRL